MKEEQKIHLLNKLILESENIKNTNSRNSKFITWKNQVERTLSSVFGINSIESNQFKQLKFKYTGLRYGSNDYSGANKNAFNRDFNIAVDSIKNYLDELTELEQISEENKDKKMIQNKSIKKVFISHSSKDKEIVEELIEVLETINIESNQIFCTSFEGYGIEIGLM